MAAPQLPFIHLNLRCNPFGEVAREERGALAVVKMDLDKWVDRLKETGVALQFLGDRGRGKTTHLLALREHFPRAPYIHFPEDEPVPEIPDAPLLFLDELQRVPRRLRGKLFTRSASWVIGSHMDHRPEFRKAGLDYENLSFDGADAEHLIRVFNARIRWATRDADQPVPIVSADAARRLIEIYYDDIRSMEGHLYTVFQNLKEVQHVEV